MKYTRMEEEKWTYSHRQKLEAFLKEKRTRIEIICCLFAMICCTVIGIAVHYSHEPRYPSSPVITDMISGLEMSVILANTTLYNERYAVWSISDENYALFDIKYLYEFLEYDKTDEIEYGKNSDCDNFAWILKGNWEKWMTHELPKMNTNEDSKVGTAFAYLNIHHGGDVLHGHALNLFIDNKMEVYLVEPQSDKVYKPKGNEILTFLGM